MHINRTATTGVALAIGIAVAATACGSSSNNGGGATSPTTAASNPSGHLGGTLNVIGEDDNGSYDTPGMYDTNSYHLARAYTRQLYSFQSSNSTDVSSVVKPDIASALPQISSDGLTYTIDLKQGVKWNAPTGARQVTAADAVRGLKMTCNPVVPFGSPGYFNLIEGMQAFCASFAKVSQSSPTAIKNFVENTQVAGLKAVSDSELQITLTQPASDFIHILTLPTASPRPIEEQSYLPDSPQERQHLISDGPYEIQSYVPNKSVVLVRNPAWVKSTDPLRPSYVNQINVTFGASEDAIQQQIAAGTQDIAVGDEPVPTSALASLIQQKSPQLHIYPTGGQNPYLVFNEVGGSSVLKKQLVRQAINYAADKASVSLDLGGTQVAPPTGQIFSQQVIGQGFMTQDMYATTNSAGNAAKAKAMLAQAGYPNGITLKFSYRTGGPGPAIAADLKASMKAAGITLVLKGVPNSQYYGKYLQVASITKSGAWDIAEPGWGPDWEGNSERSYYTPLFDGRTYGDGSSNYGDYNDPAVNTAADAALKETDAATATTDWLKIDNMIMTDAPWVPLVVNNQPTFTSPRAKNFQFFFPSDNGDLTYLYVE